jgi:hypothetical protein
MKTRSKDIELRFLRKRQKWPMYKVRPGIGTGKPPELTGRISIRVGVKTGNIRHVRSIVQRTEVMGVKVAGLKG